MDKTKKIIGLFWKILFSPIGYYFIIEVIYEHTGTLLMAIEGSVLLILFIAGLYYIREHNKKEVELT